MTTHNMLSFDSNRTIYNDRTYVRTTYSSTTNQSFRPYLTTLPVTPINVCENLLYGTKINEDVGSATYSYIHKNEHYDNTYMHTYDNPMEYHENYNIKKSLISLPHNNENVYDNPKNGIINDSENNSSSNTSNSTSPILFYLENKSLALYSCIISTLLLLIIALSIFLLNKIVRPVVINTTVNNHYDLMNMSNMSTTSITSRSTISSTLANLLAESSVDDMPSSTTTTTTTIDQLSLVHIWCPSDRWTVGCKYVCKPCGVGVCHSVTGKCICPEDIYGEFCDLWKVEDKPKRGDMMS
ncbi:unnamed protein product [Rotaria socialis]|uniref:EGF-like domain-containing protein n=1 Tax=Rotaria socialis TaxID=392032 RepID=A0A818B4D7_9BILA|nr:unnamed protein product [Rotaria socialis]CAF4297912.1 unnamed protein product [Rotaria socialis]